MHSSHSPNSSFSSLTTRGRSSIFSFSAQRCGPIASPASATLLVPRRLLTKSLNNAEVSDQIPQPQALKMQMRSTNKLGCHRIKSDGCMGSCIRVTRRHLASKKSERWKLLARWRWLKVWSLVHRHRLKVPVSRNDAATMENREERLEKRGRGSGEEEDEGNGVKIAGPCACAAPWPALPAVARTSHHPSPSGAMYK